MQWLVKFLATGSYAGNVPFFPGTAGSLVGVLLYLLLRHLPHGVFFITVVTFIFMAAWVSTKAQGIYCEQDPKEIVIDEIAGFLVAMTFHKADLLMIVLGFVIFRVFDIIKPYPIKWVERYFLSGWGVVLDDVMAGIYTNVVLWAVGPLFPRMNF